MGATVVGSAAVAGAVLAFGTFGVPIKSRRLQASQVQPLVIQGYKSAACFGTCWIALLWVPLRLTWWGTLSATIWVINGLAAIVAIQAAGLAVSQALWSGISIFVAYIWGAVVFQEPIAHPMLAIAGLFSMACGIGAIGFLVGQQCSSMDSTQSGSLPIGPPISVDDALDSLSDSNGCSNEHAARDSESQRLVGGAFVRSSGPSADHGGPSSPSDSDLPESRQLDSSPVHNSGKPCRSLHRDSAMALPGGQTDHHLRWHPTFSVGIGCAVFIGVANGSFMVPFKYASHSVTGLEFLVSFGIGAAGVSLCAMAVYTYIARIHLWQPLQLRLRQAGPPALLAGLLWSCGNSLSIIATQELGMSVAWPAVQLQLLVSTAWGALWYSEICGIRQRAVLLCATAVIILGVVCLASARGAQR